MEGFPVPRFVLVIPFIIILNLGYFFWSGNLQKERISISREFFNELVIPTPTTRSINPPKISARAALILDKSTNDILFSKNANLRFSLASATKIMTAYVALNHYQADQVLTANKTRVPAANMRLVSGERISVESLLYGLLLPSGNDAAYTLAENYPGGIKSFVGQMNKLAGELGLSNTHFADPAGLSDDGNFTTTLDLAKLALEGLKNPTFARIVSTREKTVFDVSGRIRHELTNLNKLLWEVPGVTGVKTGFTDRAGGILVTSFVQKGSQFLIVVFKSEDRFLDTKTLIDWALQSRKAR